MKLRSRITWLVLSIFVLWISAAPVLLFSQTPTQPTASQEVTPGAPAPGGAAAPTEQHLGSQFTASALIVMVINGLKKNPKFSWMSMHTPAINRTVAIVAAFVAALGIHMTFDKSGGVLTITGLTMVGMLQMGVAWFKSFIWQQTIYNFSKTAAPAVAVAPAL